MDQEFRKNSKSNRTGVSAYFLSHAHQGGIIVCEERKFIYMKPGRTAGTSILRGHLEKHLAGVIHRKDHPQAFQAWLERISDKELDEYFIFSVVRNPWDRLVSAAAFFQVPFLKLVRNIHEYWKNEFVRMHLLPLHLYTHCNGTRFVDVICRFETLQADMDLVFDQIGLERTRLPNLNQSRHEHYSRLYGQEEMAIVEQLYAKDIEYFGYVFEEDLRAKGH